MKLNSWNIAAVAGLIGGALTIGIYAGIPMAGPLALLAQVAGMLGVVAVAWVAYDYLKKKR